MKKICGNCDHFLEFSTGGGCCTALIPVWASSVIENLPVSNKCEPDDRQAEDCEAFDAPCDE